MQLDIVIPYFNNSSTIGAVLAEIDEELGLLVKAHTSLNVVVIIVDDGSKLSPERVLVGVNRKHFSLRLVSLSRNFGQLAAIYAGYASSLGDATVVMSADGQDPASVLHLLVQEFLDGHGVVIGVRNSNTDPISRRLTSAVSLKIIRSVVPQMPTTWFDISLVSKAARDQILLMEGRYRFTQGDILDVGFQPTQIGYDRRRRLSGRSGYSFSRRFENFRNCVLETEYFPRLFGRLGAVVLTFSASYSIWIFISFFLFGGSPNGWSPLMIVALVTLGLNLFVSSILMQFVWRIYSTTQRKPLFIIQASKELGT